MEVYVDGCPLHYLVARTGIAPIPHPLNGSVLLMDIDILVIRNTGHVPNESLLNYLAKYLLQITSTAGIYAIRPCRQGEVRFIAV